MIERKYRKQVNSNGWMRKLQLWTFRSATPSFVGYCPFFWFTWLCVLLIPVTLIFRAAGFMFWAIGAAIPENFWIVRPARAKLIKLYYLLKHDGYTIEQIREFELNGLEGVFEWIDITPDWMNCVLRAVAKQEKRAAKQLESSPKMQALVRKLPKYSAYIVKTLLALASIFILIEVGPTVVRWITSAAVAIWGIVTSLTLAGLIYSLVLLFKASVVLGIAWIIIYVLVRVVQGMRGCPKRPGKITIWYRIGIAVSIGLEFLSETIRALYVSECPLIEWGDESRPIEKIK